MIRILHDRRDESKHDYRQDLRLTKRRAISFLGQLRSFDLIFGEDRQSAFRIAQRLKGRINKICRTHLRGESQNQVDEEPSEDRFIPNRNIKYLKDLEKIRGSVDLFFDQMKAYDHQDDFERQSALNVARNFMDKIDALCTRHLVGEGQPYDEEEEETQIKIEDVQVAVGLVRECKNLGKIGDNYTFLAMKNSDSYMLATCDVGLLLIENRKRTYSTPSKSRFGDVMDAIYIPALDSYLIAYNYQLFKKDINDQPPYLFLDVQCGVRLGACFRYSNIHSKLMINEITIYDKRRDQMNYERLPDINEVNQDKEKVRNKISVVDLKKNKKEPELSVKKEFGLDIWDFRLYGKDQNQVVAVTEDGYIILYNFYFKHRLSYLLDKCKINLDDERDECATSVAVCERNEYIFVDIAKRHFSPLASRMVVFKISDEKLDLKASIDQFEGRIGWRFGFDCFGYFGSHIMLVGLSWKRGRLQVFDYDTKEKVLRELEDKQVGHGERFPVKLNRLGDKFYYTGDFGKVMSLSV